MSTKRLVQTSIPFVRSVCFFVRVCVRVARSPTFESAQPRAGSVRSRYITRYVSKGWVVVDGLSSQMETDQRFPTGNVTCTSSDNIPVARMEVGELGVRDAQNCASSLPPLML